MKSLFPFLYEIAATMGVTQNVGRGLTAAQQDAQREIRSRFSTAVPNSASGIVLPWYQNGPAEQPKPTTNEKEIRFRDRRGVDQVMTLRESRDMTVTGSTAITGDQGGMTVALDVPEIGSAFRDNLVFERLGARVLGGLQEDVILPQARGLISAEWRSETAQAGDTDENFQARNFKPHRVTVSIPVSDRLMIQGKGIEGFLRVELMSALAVEIQRVGTVGLGASNQPMGIVNTPGIGSVVGGADGAAPTYDNLCDLEYAVTGTGKADRGNLGWLVSPAARRKLRKTPIFSGGAVPIWRETEAASLLGHQAGVTTAVPDTLTKGASAGICSALVFGEFSELFVCLWGPGIIVTAVRDRDDAIAGRTQLYATCYVDTGVRTPTAFAAMLDALCL